MLYDCDAVILVQAKPSLRGAEKDLIKFAREGDRHIRLEDKLFVFFGRMDSFATPEAFQRDFAHVVDEWHKEANLTTARLVAGSAGAHLVLNGLAGPDTLKDIGDPAKLATDLRRVLGNGTLDADQLRAATGIDTIKATLNHYLNTERVAIVDRRCAKLCAEILLHGESVYATVRASYPEDPDEARRRQEEDRTLAFNRWWSQREENLRADFNEYFRKALSLGFSDVTVADFRQRYQELVRQEMSALPARTPTARNRIFMASIQHGFAPERANIDWREKLYHDVRHLIDNIACQLAAEIERDTRKLIDFIGSQLWDNPRIRFLLVGDDRVFQDRLQHSLKVLFLRFARPLAEALIRAPIGSQTRLNIVRDSGIDLDILDLYYPEDGEEIYRQLKRYLRHGVKLITDPEVSKNALDGRPTRPDRLQQALKAAVAGI